jgi:hypothetical protein
MKNKLNPNPIINSQVLFFSCRTTVRLKSVAFPKGSYDFLANVRGSVSLILAFHFVLTQNETKKSRLTSE